jgi:hypothetical protein
MTALEKLVAAVAEFHNWVKLPNHHDLEPKLMYEFTDSSLWSDQYQVDPSLTGCYVFVDDEESIYYVGSVSANSSFGYRFANGYVCKDPEDPLRVKRLGNASKANRIMVIDLPREYAFVAPALEQFLITYLNPSANAKDSVQALREELRKMGKLPS